MNIKDIENRLMSGQLNVRFHNGVGFLQAYLTPNVRLHVWHPDLTVPLESFGNRHNHRFDLESHVLLGVVVDTQFSVVPAPEQGWGLFNLYSVQPAHLEEALTPKLISKDWWEAKISSIEKIPAGQGYSMQRGVFHESRAEGLTVTVMRKSNQSEKWARIMATCDQKPEHGMARKIPQCLLDQCFFSALRKLPVEANAIVHRLTEEDK